GTRLRRRRRRRRGAGRGVRPGRGRLPPLTARTPAGPGHRADERFAPALSPRQRAARAPTLTVMSHTLGEVLSVNLATSPRPTAAKPNPTGIGKKPTPEPVHVSAPGPKGVGGSGLQGDTIGDRKHHGGDDQAVYAYAREDLDWWQQHLGRELGPGAFGENLTTRGLDLTGALVGERWRVGDTLLLEAACP